MSSVFRCFLLFGLLATLDGRQFRCDYQYFNTTDGWLKLHRIPADWGEARLQCQLEGSTLVSPLTTELGLAMKVMMEQEAVDCGVYTGIHAFFSKRDFHSVEGTPLWRIPHKWAQGEPDSYSGVENCTQMLKTGELALVNCTDLLPFACYKKYSKLDFISNCGTIDREYSYEGLTGSCYKFHKEPRAWSLAYKTCAAEGGYLAIINSEAEARVVKEVLARYPTNSLTGAFKEVTFIGYHDWSSSSQREFLTIEGQTLPKAGYDVFDDGQPNNLLPGQSCGGLDRNGKFNDMWCYEQIPFLCEKDPDSLLCD